jgi:hypothetical protein
MLRWLFLILLLCNLVVFVWGYRQHKPEPDTLPPLPPGVPEILLLDEQRHAESAEPATAPTPDPQAPSTAVDPEPAETPASTATEPATDQLPASPPELSCIRLGPLEQEAAASAVINALSESDHQPDLRVVSHKEQSGYWVLITPETEDPDFVVSNLQLAGISDVWRFTKGDLAGMVSLGLYSSLADAEARQKELSQRGFDAEIRPRQIDKYSYWVHTRYDPQSAPAMAALEQAFNQNPWLEFPPTPCTEDIAAPEENP